MATSETAIPAIRSEEKVCLLMRGQSRNGKNRLMEACMRTLDYAAGRMTIPRRVSRAKSGA
jgi:hypothetical protein